MKKTNFLLALVVFSSNFLFAQTWDILDKSMAAYNQDGGASNNGPWVVAQGSSAGSSTTQQVGYVNFTKTNVGSSGKWAWVRPVTAFSNLINNTAYSIEIKARVNNIDIAETATNFQANQISLRLGSINTAARIYLKYGDGLTSGFVSSSSGGTSNVYTVNTSVWQIYRMVFHADHLKYDVYIDGLDEPVLENISVNTTGDQNGVYFGAESYHRCNMDIEYVKMGTGDFFSKPRISSMALSQNNHITGNEATVTVTANTALIDNDNKLLFSLVDLEGNEIVAPVEATVTDNVATANLVIPASIVVGQYKVKAIASSQINEMDVTAKTVSYEIQADLGTATASIISDKSISISANMLNAGQTLSIKTIASDASLSEVAVYSLTGNKISHQFISGREYQLQAVTVPGMYILKVCLNNNTSKEFKILVK